MNELTIRASNVQGKSSVTILHLKGHLHGPTEAELLDRARQAHEDGIRYLLLDMSELEVLASAGLRAIQNIFKLFTPQSDIESMKQRRSEPYKSPYLKLVCPNPQLYYVLSITGFLQTIPIFNNIEEAIGSFAG
ncbi:MAG: STAS domain-containing protein [Chloroflexi bacterium]|nr:STAS domain-containing protein [Chloroflexota bacterium]